jgi:hypothetical protein
MPRMRLRAKRSEPATPRTVMGLWLRAFLLRDAQRRRELGAKLNGGKLGFNRDEAAVVQAACQLAVRRLWGSGYDVRDITAAVAVMREASLANDHTPPYGQLEMEAVIRSALGEADVDMTGIPRPLAYEIQGVALGYGARMLGLSEPEVVRLICEAEQIAFDHDSKPPLAA